MDKDLPLKGFTCLGLAPKHASLAQQYALSTKRNTIKTFEKCIAMRERQLKKAEKKLQHDALTFEEFLRENDQESADALKLAAQETINKLQMTAELKKASMEVQAVKSEIATTEFLLKEYMKYGIFLLQLSPRHWQIQQALKIAQASKSKANIIHPQILTRFFKRHKAHSQGPENLAICNQICVLGLGRVQKNSKTTEKIGRACLRAQRLAESFSSEESLEFLLDDEMDFDLVTRLYFLI
ncbi:Coiled-coil domain-containing protein 38 [Saguinus oedipus]|uniref:Coiled-coil domain-containing protein 38 n=1 Tax=Saguinus oedipus TaxID=9490 RepID=A0ABQ9UZ93_SAGOE|nr:Coiled-coil domain-containing protein 38 [Saguinus oedipus]